MKLITRFQLASMNVSELHSLQRKIEQELPQVPRGSRERFNGLTSLQNIKRELSLR